MPRRSRWSSTRPRSSYAQLLDYFWRTIDPTVRDRQFCDVGSPYRTGDLPHDGEQLKRGAGIAGGAREDQAVPRSRSSPRSSLAGTFYPAEDYHQDYYKKNPVRYKYYRTSCGRDARLKELWGSKPAP